MSRVTVRAVWASSCGLVWIEVAYEESELTQSVGYVVLTHDVRMNSVVTLPAAKLKGSRESENTKREKMEKYLGFEFAITV